MTRRNLLLLHAVVFMGFFGILADAQATRKSVSAAEVNGTFRYQFTGKFKGNYDEIKILALGKGRLKMTFALTYPFIDGTGGQMANVGEDEGFAVIDGDNAIFTSTNTPECRINIKFVKPGLIKVTHLTDVTDCGYGLNVSANGTYKKVSSARPKFEN